MTDAPTEPVPNSRWLVIGLIAGAIGLIFTCCPYGVSILAPILAPLGLGILVAAVLVSLGPDSRSAGWRASLAVAGALGVAAVVLSAGGLLTRHFARGDYFRAAGTQVEAAVIPARCSWINQSRRGLSHTLSCQGVTWTIGGQTQTGSMEVDGADLPQSADLKSGTAPVKVGGYAKGDAAVSLSGMKKNYAAARVGVVPLWAGGAGLVLLVGSWLLAARGTPEEAPTPGEAG
jgi:hypothetical protein